MAINSLPPGDLVIPPYSGPTTRGDSASSARQNHRPIVDPEICLDPPNPLPYPSAPDLHQVVVVVSRERSQKPKLTSPAHFRVGNVGLRRSQTWPRHMVEKNNNNFSYPQGPKVYRSTPNLRAQPSAHQTQPHSTPRRRHTWPSLSTKGKTKRRGLRLDISPQIGRGRVASQASGGSPVELAPLETSEPPMRGPNMDLEPLESLRRPKVSFEEAMPFWESYNKMADFEDREFVKALGVNLDTLLIFAGLFSAVNTAFIIEALKTIQPDQAEKTNDLIRSVIIILHNSTFTDSSLHNGSFAVTPKAFRSTAEFFVSLTFSLTAAFGAVIGKQWLNYYEREGGLKPPAARGRERQKKFEARDKWHMEGVIETLPTLLQISLFLFLIALVDFLWAIHPQLAHIVMGFSLVPVVFYITMTTIAVIYPIAPFQTRLTISIHDLCHRVKVGLVKLGQLEKGVWGGYKIRRVLDPLPSNTANFIPRFWRHEQIRYSTENFPSPSSLTTISEPNLDLPNPDFDASLRCLITYIQRASIPQDLNALLTAMDSLPIRVSTETAHRSLMGSLIELSISRILGPWYQYFRTNKQISNTGSNFRQLLKALKLAFSQYGYGITRDGYKRVLSDDADRWIVQEVFDAIFQGPLDVDSVSMAADIISLSKFPIHCSAANLEALWQSLERPSNDPERYLPYVSLLSHALGLKANPVHPEYERLLQVLVSTMWIDGRIDLDYYRGRLRLRVFPEWLGDNADVHRFSEFLLQWRREGENHGRVPTGWWNGSYAWTVAELLDSHQGSDFWPRTLEESGHIPSLLDIMSASQSLTAMWNALLGFLILWNRRWPSAAPGFSDLYLTPTAVAAVLHPWQWVRSLPRRIPLDRLMEYTAAYLEEAKRLQLLDGHDFTEFIGNYKTLGNRFMKGDDRLHLWYERVDKLVTP